MQSVFPVDICSEILAHVRLKPLGRISLICKNARQQTWSLASRIDIKGYIECPFDSIFQYTGFHLKMVRLSHLEQSPTTIRHLVDHCPRLEHLIIEKGIILNFSNSFQLIAQLIERVESLTLSLREPHSARYLSVTDRNLGWLQTFLKILYFCADPIKVKHFSIEEDKLHLPSAKTDTAVPQYFFEKFGSLETVKLPIHASSLVWLLKGFRTLKRIHARNTDRVHLRTIMNWFKDLSNTQIGWNIFLDESTYGYKNGVPIFAYIMKNYDVPSVQLMSALPLINGAKVDPSHVSSAVEAMIGCPGRWPAFLQAAVAPGALSTILPPMDQIGPCITTRDWALLIRDLDRPLLRRTFEVLGAPTESFNPTDVLKMLFKLELSLMKSKIEFLEQVGLLDMTQLESYFPPSATDCNLFLLPKSTEMWDYLLAHTSREYAVSEMRRSIEVGGEQLASPLVRLLRENNFVNYQVSYVLQYFQDEKHMLSFPDPDDFKKATESYIIDDADLLRRIVEATGWENIDANCRGRLFWRLLRAFRASGDSPSLWYWIGLIESDPSVEPIFVSQDAVNTISHHFCSNHAGVMNVVGRFRELILKQARNSEHSFAMLRALGYPILNNYDPINQGGDFWVKSAEFAEEMVHQFFLPLVRVLATSGRCPCSTLLYCFPFLEGSRADA